MADIQLRVPSASSVLQAAFRVVEWELAMARELLFIPARVLALLEDVEGIIHRVQRLLDRVERTVAAIDGIVATATDTVARVGSTIDTADSAVARVNRTVDSADSAVGRVGSTIDAAHGVVDRVGATVDSADAVVLRVESTVDSADNAVTRVSSTVDAADGLVVTAGGLVDRVVPMLDLAESALAPVRPVVEALLVDAELDPELAKLVATRITEVLVYADKTVAMLEPITDQVLGSVDPDEVRAVVQFIDHLPVLGATLERDVLPVLASLDTVAPEVHQILEVAQQCLEAVAGIPGFQLLRRRGENGKSGV